MDFQNWEEKVAAIMDCKDPVFALRADFNKTGGQPSVAAGPIFNFILAIDTFKRVNGKTFPTWTDVLEVVRKLGYRKTMPSELSLGSRAEAAGPRRSGSVSGSA